MKYKPPHAVAIFFFGPIFTGRGGGGAHGPLPFPPPVDPLLIKKNKALLTAVVFGGGGGGGIGSGGQGRGDCRL